MRRVSLLMLLFLSGCYYPYGYYPYGYYPYGYYGYGVYSYPAPQPYYGVPYYGNGEVHASGQPAAVDPNNCGTPEEPKPCYNAYR
jgi:hypothetical protein